MTTATKKPFEYTLIVHPTAFWLPDGSPRMERVTVKEKGRQREVFQIPTYLLWSMERRLEEEGVDSTEARDRSIDYWVSQYRMEKEFKAGE